MKVEVQGALDSSLQLARKFCRLVICGPGDAVLVG
jgi:hypothetical protein